VVSLFEAKLPLPFAVSLGTSSASSANRAEPIRFFFIPSRGAYLLFDVQVCKPKTPAVTGPDCSSL